jgi:AraC-like DNA-binding protein
MMLQRARGIKGAPDFGPLVEDFDAIEALNAFYVAYGWDCRYRQVGEGRLRVKVASHVTEQLGYGRESVNRRIWGHASSGDGVFSVILAVSDAIILINGRELNRGRLFVVPPNESMDIVLGRGADPLTMLVPVDTFNDCCPMTDSDETAAAIRTMTAYEVGDRELEPIRHLALEALGNTREPEEESAFDESFLIELARLLKSDECRILTQDPYLRLRKHDATRRAIAYIHDNLKETIRMEVLCELCATSLSTLERRFKKFLGVSPKHYILAARLNRVRRDLLHPDYFDLSIAEVAMRYNLLHMGRFSAQYRILFGRLPSEDREIAMNGAP